MLKSDLTYYKEGNTIMAGGYNIDQIIKNEGQIPYEINIVEQTGGGDKAKLGVPSGIFYVQQRVDQTYVPYSNHELIPDDLYENLLSLMSPETKKNKKSKKKKISKEKYSKKRTKKLN